MRERVWIQKYKQINGPDSDKWMKFLFPREISVAIIGRFNQLVITIRGYLLCSIV